MRVAAFVHFGWLVPLPQADGSGGEVSRISTQRNEIGGFCLRARRPCKLKRKRPTPGGGAGRLRSFGAASGGKPTLQEMPSVRRGELPSS